MNVLQELEQEQIAARTKERPIPDFAPGDTVRVNVKVVEGSRERVQAFEGVCIARKNRGINSAFTVRKISYGEGVERIFPLYSPQIASIEVVRRGRVRRAKLYYLRGPHRQGGADPGEAGRARRVPPRRRTRSRQRNSAVAPGVAPSRGERGGKGGGVMAEPKTLFDKIWEAHVVHEQDDGTCLLYIDRHLVHEVTSPQAFEGLRQSGRKVRRPDATLAVPDHNVPTTDRSRGIAEEQSRIQVEALQKNCREFGITLFDVDDIRQGIVHIIGPEQGFTLPGMTIVCGDSHTSTHGAFGALAFGIGTSEVEHVLATQTLLQKRPKNMRITVAGALPFGVTAKDVILAIIGRIGTAGGTGHVIEYAGDVVRGLSMAGRMTICNMSIEAGARAGLIAPDDTTYQYIQGRPMAPKAGAFEQAVAHWRTLPSDPGARYDREVELDAPSIEPQVTWGTSPQDVQPISGKVPDPRQVSDPARRAAMERSLEYMGLEPNTPMSAIRVDKVFFGSCTNARIEDLRAAAQVVRGRKVAPTVHAMVVPGSGLIKHQAEEEGLDRIFLDAGFEWREAGCSMCLGMNPDQLKPGERCASTSNRNFEGRQGPGGRTHLMSPAMAAAAALTGHITDVRKLA